MDCTCPECAAASAAFTVDDLKQFSSTIDYSAGEEAGVTEGSQADLVPPKKPAPSAGRKRRPTPRPVRAAPARAAGKDE